MWQNITWEGRGEEGGLVFSTLARLNEFVLTQLYITRTCLYYTVLPYALAYFLVSCGVSRLMSADKLTFGATDITTI